MPFSQLCPILRTERLNRFAYSISLYAGPVAVAARPGQFVHIKCGAGQLLRRPVSICDVDGDRLHIVFEVRGEGTAWLSRRKAGEQLDVLGPLGHGFDLTEEKLLLVGGGIGVPPLLFSAKSARIKPDVCLGFRDAEHAMLIHDFEEAADCVTVTTDDGGMGAKGYVGLQVEAALRSRQKKYESVLACGPRVMLRMVAEAAARSGVPCQVSMEERMGCGVGACLVCACKMADGAYRHVCKCGPVFDAAEVDWNEE